MTIADHSEGDAVVDREMSTEQTVDAYLGCVEALAGYLAPDLAVVMSPFIPGLALLLAKLRKAQTELKEAAEFVEDELTRIMPGRNFDCGTPVGAIEMHTGATRKEWDKAGLTDSMVHAIAGHSPNLVNADTGEMVNLMQHVRELVEMFTDAATPSWKVTGLRKYGINPDEYCTTTWGRKTIAMPYTSVKAIGIAASVEDDRE